MPTVRTQPRVMCSSCGQSCRVVPSIHLVHGWYRQQPVWHYVSLTLCPPCRVVHHDWWLDQAQRGQRVTT